MTGWSPADQIILDHLRCLKDRRSAAGRRECTKVARPAAAESSRVPDRAPPAAGGWVPPQAPKRRPVSCSALLGGGRPRTGEEKAAVRALGICRDANAEQLVGNERARAPRARKKRS